MTNEPSPRPWRAIYARILDARGKAVCVCEKDSMHGRADDDTAKADAALIVDAVNHMDYDLSIRNELNDSRAEIDELRDLVRRMMEKLAVLNAGYRLMLSEGPEDAEMADLCTRTEALVREARAAIGEEAP